MLKIEIDIKFFNPEAKMPKKGTSNSAAFDCYATSKEDLGDGRVVYGLGFGLNPGEYKVTLKPRSSVHKTGMILSNGVGLGDPDYRGEYKAVFYNVIPSLPNYEIGDRIVQIEIEEAKPFYFNDIGSLDLPTTERGAGGFGSTGLK